METLKVFPFRWGKGTGSALSPLLLHAVWLNPARANGWEIEIKSIHDEEEEPQESDIADNIIL